MTNAILNQITQTLTDLYNHPFSFDQPSADPPPPQITYTPPTPGSGEVAYCAKTTVVADRTSTPVQVRGPVTQFTIAAGKTFTLKDTNANIPNYNPNYPVTELRVEGAYTGSASQGQWGLSGTYTSGVCPPRYNPAPAPEPAPNPPPNPINFTIPFIINNIPVNITPTINLNPKFDTPVTINFPDPKGSNGDPNADKCCIDYSYIRSIVRAEIQCIKKRICGEVGHASYDIPSFSGTGTISWQLAPQARLRYLAIALTYPDGISYFDGGIAMGDFGVVAIGSSGVVISKTNLEFPAMMIPYDMETPGNSLYYNLRPNVSAEVRAIVDILPNV